MGEGGGAIKTATASPAILQGHGGLDAHTAEEEVQVQFRHFADPSVLL